MEPIHDRILADSTDAPAPPETLRAADDAHSVSHTNAGRNTPAGRDGFFTSEATDLDEPAPLEVDDSLSRRIAPLVALARRGDRGSWSTLYDLYAPVVHGVLLVRVGSPDADDLTQDVFVAAMRKIGSLRDDAMFVSWLCSIARRRAGTLFRVRSLFRRALPRAAQARPAHADAPALRESSITPSRLLDAIRSLPAAYHETLALRLIEQLQGPEIARRLGLTHGSVRVNLTRGMKLLRDKLAPAFPEHSP